MGMIVGLIGLIGAFIFGIVGGIVGWKKGKDSQWRFLIVILGILAGTVLGFVAGFGLGWLLISQYMP